MNRALVVIICLAFGCAKPARADASAPAAQEHPLKIVYVRSGGFAGFLDELSISGDSLELTRRKKLTFQRRLSADEQKSLAQLEQAALAAPAPGTIGAPGADTFQWTLTVGD